MAAFFFPKSRRYSIPSPRVGSSSALRSASRRLAPSLSLLSRERLKISVSEKQRVCISCSAISRLSRAKLATKAARARERSRWWGRAAAILNRSRMRDDVALSLTRAAADPARTLPRLQPLLRRWPRFGSSNRLLRFNRGFRIYLLFNCHLFHYRNYLMNWRPRLRIYRCDD